MKQVPVRFEEAAVEAARERVGARGLGPLLRRLLDEWLADGSRSAPSPEGPKQEPPAYTPARPRPKADRPAGIVAARKDTQGPTCPRCTGLATYIKGKPRCMAGCKQ